MRIDARAFATMGLGYGALEFAAIGLLVITPSSLPRYEASVPAFDFSDAVPRKSFGDKVPPLPFNDTL